MMTFQTLCWGADPPLISRPTGYESPPQDSAASRNPWAHPGPRTATQTSTAPKSKPGGLEKCLGRRTHPNRVPMTTVLNRIHVTPPAEYTAPVHRRILVGVAFFGFRSCTPELRTFLTRKVAPARLQSATTLTFVRTGPKKQTTPSPSGPYAYRSKSNIIAVALGSAEWGSSIREL
jgi:hypothetical protein